MENQDNVDNTYTIIRLLDQDCLSSTYQVRNIMNNNQYVAKVMKIENQEFYNRELQMTTIASGLNNPHVIHLVGHGNGTIRFKGYVQNNANYLILDYHQHGNLFDYIKIPRRGFTELHTQYIFYKILIGVQAIHGAGICHRDLKLENILLDQNYNPIICNFSLSTNNNVNALNDFVGTKSYLSPQIIAHQTYNGFKADIFSLGALLFNLLTGMKGFSHGDKKDQIYELISQHKFDEY